MAQIPKLISKTKIMNGYQCHKNLYWAIHNKQLIPPVSPELQALFDQGNAVTEMARKLYPMGILVDFPAYDFIGSLHKTRDLLKEKTEIIFEAAFEYLGCYARADIIKYNPISQRWSIIEVKMTTKVKDEHLDDVGLQVWIMANAGLPIEKISIMHLNNLYRHSSLKENTKNLFIEEDVTDKLRESYRLISPRLTDIFKAIKSDTVPEVSIGKKCFVPRECQFLNHCWGQLEMPTPNVFDLPALNNKKWSEAKWDLYERGHIGLTNLDEKDKTEILNTQQNKALEAIICNKRFVDSAKIQNELASWKWPLIFLDFETINPAVPRYQETWPFMQVTFQFSLHVLSTREEQPQHFDFLAEDLNDPREALAKKLIKVCPLNGTIVAYFAKFESERLKELADHLPEYADKLNQIRERLVDPLPLLRESVYDPKFGDSFSIKSVGPALLGDRFSYSHLKVGDGGAAQRAFEELISSKTSPMRKNELKAALLSYCEQDTLVMVELVRWLYEQK